MALRPFLMISISLLTVTAMGQEKSPPIVPASCPVTRPPQKPFTPPPPYEREESTKSFLIGTEKLWTALRNSGVWYWAPHKPGHEQDVQPLTEKTFWGSTEFKWDKEYPPELKVTGRRLDGSAPPLLTLPPTNAFPGPTAAMLSGVYVPAPGCWEITAEYKGEKLSFIVWVKPVKQDKQ